MVIMKDVVHYNLRKLSDKIARIKFLAKENAAYPLVRIKTCYANSDKGNTPDVFFCKNIDPRHPDWDTYTALKREVSKWLMALKILKWGDLVGEERMLWICDTPSTQNLECLIGRGGILMNTKPVKSGGYLPIHCHIDDVEDMAREAATTLYNLNILVNQGIVVGFQESIDTHTQKVSQTPIFAPKCFAKVEAWMSMREAARRAAEKKIEYEEGQQQRKEEFPPAELIANVSPREELPVEEDLVDHLPGHG